MSKKSDAKKARRKKRQSSRDSRWVPHEVVEQLQAAQEGIVADLAEFDERITERGWVFDEDESDAHYAIWYYEPSGHEVEDGLPVTALWLDAEEDGEIVHVTFVGSQEYHAFTHEQLFAHLDEIEAYRAGEPLPTF